MCNSNSVFRVQLEKIYENMGGTSLDPTANTVLTNLQKKLNTVLDKLAGQFAESLVPKIHEQMNTLGSILCKIKGPQLQKSQLVGEVDAVLEPLMELLEDKLQQYASECEKTVLKYLLKELWKITITSMEKIVVLPP
uniref:Phorbol ester/diacylglycerol-binding protein unc-13 n=1 Tax=Parascaris univalens TaxID=6257 RepID=A0A915BSQ5_PARUN